MRPVAPSRPLRWAPVLGLMALVACAEPAATPTGPDFGKGGGTTGPTVSSTNPPESPRDTTLDVTVLGSGFDAGSRVDFLLNGAADAKVRANSTRYVSSRELVANITIDADAVPSFRDVQVTTTTGKKGIGTEMFEVLAIEELDAPAGFSRAHDVNVQGTVVGQSWNTAGCGGLQLVPTAWNSAGVRQELPLPAGSCGGAAWSITDGGTILGVTDNETNQGRTVVRWLANGSGYDVEVIELATYEQLSVGDLNDAGHMVGVRGSQPFWWSGADWVALAVPPGASRCTFNSGDLLTEADAIAGQCDFASALGVYWPAPGAQPVALPQLSGYDSHHYVYAMNESGTIVGDAWKNTKRGAVQMAVRWVPSGTGQCVDTRGWCVGALGDLGGGKSLALDVDQLGRIVGRSKTGGSANSGAHVAFLWTESAGIVSLGSLSPGKGSSGEGIAALPSGAALVAGTAENAKGEDRAVVWRP